MSVSIDEKVVQMRFDNAQFEKGVQTSLKSIADLNKATEFTASQSGIKKLKDSFDKFNLSKATAAVDTFSVKVSALGVAGAEVIRRITDSAIDLGKSVFNTINKPLEMAKSGGIARALNIAQAKFQLEGLGVAWEKIYDDIDYGVSDTAYGLDAAAKVASQLVASNVELGDDMRAALRGISGVAAMTSSSYEDIGAIFTTVAGQGKMMTMQLRQLEARGLNVAAKMGDVLGKSETEIRQMVSDGKINFEIFSKAMDKAFGEHAKEANSTFSGAMSNVQAALSRIGALFATPFYDAIIKPLNSLKDLINIIKEAMVEPTDRLGEFMKKVGETASTIMKFEEVKDFVRDITTGAMNLAGHFAKILENIAAAFLTVFPPKAVQNLADMAANFKEMTGNLKLTKDQMDKIQNVARGVFSVFSILGNAIGLFFDIIKDIAHSKAGDFIGKAVQALANGLQHIDYFVKIVRVAYKTASEAFGGIGGVLRNFGTFIDMIFAALDSKFDGISDILSILKGNVDGLSDTGSIALANLTKGIREFADAVFERLGKAGEMISGIFDRIKESVVETNKAFSESKQTGGMLAKIINGVVLVARIAIAVLTTLLHTVADLIKDLNITDIIEEGLTLVLVDKLNSLVKSVQSFITNLKGGFTDIGSLSSTIKTTLGSISGAFVEFQKSMQVGRIVLIAAAVGILSIALYGLSKIGSLKELGIAIAALASISSVLVILGRSFKSIGDGKFIKKGATQIVLMAAAIAILANVMVKLSALNFDQVSNASIALAAAMGILVGAFNLMASSSSKNEKAMSSQKKWVKGAFNLILMAEAIKVVANVIVKLGQLDTEQLGIGLIGLASAVAAMAVAFNMMASSSQKSGEAFSSSKKWVEGAFKMVLMAEAINVLSGVIIRLSKIKPEKLAVGVAGLAVSVLALGSAFALMSSSFSSKKSKDGFSEAASTQWVQSAANLVLMAAAIKVLSGVIVTISQLKPEQLVTGIIGLAAAVGVMVFAFKSMFSASKQIGDMEVTATQWVQNATQLVIVAAAIKILGGVIKELAGLEGLDQGILGLGVAMGALVGTVAAINALGKESGQLLKGAAAMVIISVAFGAIAGALTALSMIPKEDLAVTLAATVGPLLALSAACIAMKDAVKGAAAMVIVAAAFDLLVPAIILLGSANMTDVSNALYIMAAAVGATALTFVVFGVASKVLGKSVPQLLSMSASLLMAGAGFALFGAGLYAISVALEKLGNTLTNLFVTLRDKGGQAVETVQQVIENTDLGDVIWSMIKKIGKLLLKAIANLGQIIKKAIPRIIGWGMEVILGFINGLADAVDIYLPKILEAIHRLGGAIFESIQKEFGEMFDNLSGVQVAKIAAVVIAIGILLKSLSKSLSSIKASNVVGALVVVGGVIGIAIALMKLSQIPWQDLTAAVAAVGVCMIGMTAMMKTLSQTKFDVKTIAAMIVGAGVLILIAKTLEPLAAYNYKQVLAAGAALALVLGVYGLVFKYVTAVAPVAKNAIPSIAAFLLGSLAIIPITLALRELAKEDYANMLGAAASLSAVMLAYAAVFGILSLIPVAGAVTALANLAIAIGGLAAILLILGAIRQIPGVEWLVSEGSEFANQLGEAIGGFVGSIVSGFGKAISSLLPQIGLDLSEFMVNAMPFFLGVKMIGNDTMEAVKSLAEALMLLTAAELVQGIASFFGADQDFKKLGEQLGDFADGMKTFADKTKDIDADQVEAAGRAAKMLAEVAGAVPLTGGLLSDLMGDRDLASFGKNLVELGKGLKKFGKQVKGLDTDAVEAATNSAKMLAELNQDIPLQGGLLGDLLGNKDLAQFGQSLPELGKGLKKFAKSTGKLNNEAIEAAATSAGMLAELNQNIPLQGGLLGDLMGNRDLSSFGNSLPDLGTGLKSFADNVYGIKTNAATDAATVGAMLGELANSIPNSGGLKSFFSGDSKLDKFGKQLPDFGEGIKGFSDEIEGINSTNVRSASTLITSIIDVLIKLKDNDTSNVDLSNFATNLTTLGTGYKDFVTNAGTSTTNLDNFSKAIDKIIAEIEKVSKVDTSKMKTFTDDLKGLSEAGIKSTTDASKDTVKGAIKAINDMAPDFKTAAEGFVDQMKTGIKTNGYKISDELETQLTSASTSAKSEEMKAKFDSSAGFLVDGFVNGMTTDERIQRIIEAGKKVANAARKGVEDELRIESPSKDMIEDGEYVDEGLATGIENGTPMVLKAGANLVDKFKGVISGISDTAGTGSSSFSIEDLTGKLNGTIKKDKTGKDAGKGIGKNISDGVASTAGDASKSGRKVGSSASSGATSGVKFGAKQLKKALESYRYIMGEYLKQGERFPKKMLEAITSKKGLGNLKVTSDYILSGIDNKYLRTAASNLGTDLAKAINSSMRKELKSDNKTASILSKLDKAGQSLVDARKRAKDAKSTINDTKKSRKEIAKARKELSAANKDISKYQKQVDKYQKQLKKAGSGIAQTLTEQSIGELNNSMNTFKKVFNKMGDKTGNYLAKIPSVLSAYISNVKSSASYAKGVVAAVEKTFGANIQIMDKATNEQIKKYENKLKEAKKKEKEAKKLLNSKDTSKKDRKKAEKDAKAAANTITNLNTKIAAEQKKLGGASVVDKFAERLYYNSDAYKDEVNNVKSATKSIKKIQKAARKAKKNLDKATKAEDKKKYADELNDLKKQLKEQEKIAKKSATAIAKGPKKALKAYKEVLKETLKGMLSISSLSVEPKIKLEGFDKFEKSSNLTQELTNNTDIFAKAVATAGQKFSIFGDITKTTTKAFEFFNGAVSSGINLLERFTKVGSVEKQALFENADSQLEAYEEFYNGIEALRKKGLSDTMIDNLKQQGPEALNYIRGFLSMSEDEIASYNNRIAKMNAYEAKNYANEIKASMKKAQKFSGDLAQLASLGVREEIIENFKEMGQESAQGYIDSLLNTTEDNIKELNDIYTEYAKASSTSMLEAAEAQYQAHITYNSIIEKLKETTLDPGIIKDIQEMGEDEAIAYGRAILNAVDDIPKLNELYWKSMSNDKTMRQQMEEANAETERFKEGLQKLTDMGLHKDFVDYVKDMGVDEGMAVIERAIREIGSLEGELRDQEVALFNQEYLKTQDELGKSPMEVLLENIDSQIKGYDEYKANLEIVLSKLGGDSKSEYFKYLKEMGLDGAEYVEALANATEDQIASYRDMIDQREARNRQERAQSLIDSWNEELDTVRNYTSNMAKLINRGASQTLVDDLAAMDIKEAATKVEALLDMDQNAFSQWNQAYNNMMNKDVGDLVNKLVADYAAAGGVATVEMATDTMTKTQDIVVQGSYNAATKQVTAYQEGTLATYPVLQETGKNAGTTTVDAFTQAITENIGTIPVSAVVNAFALGLEDKVVANKLTTAGKAICTGVMNGIKKKKDKLVKLGNTTAKDLHDVVKVNLSRAKGRAISTSFCSGINTVIDEFKPILIENAEAVAKGMNAMFADHFSYDNGFEFGKHIAMGMIDGMISMAEEIKAASERLVAEIFAGMAREASARELAEKQREAWARADAAGIERQYVTIGVEDALDKMSESLQAESNAIKEQLDGEFIIKPILDLSTATKQANRLSDMIDNSTVGASIRYVRSADEDTTTSGNVTYNFEQNNYSPEALSREEIYRQTRNQFAQLKGAVE